MAVKIYNKLKQDLLQLAQYVRGGFARKEDVKVYVGTCGTAAGTAAKVVSVDAFPTVSSGGATLPVTGTVIAVKFSNTNTAGSPTLNVNGTGAASIWYGSAVYGTGTPTVAGSAGQYTFYVWNGTYWVWQGQGIASSGGGGGSVGALNTNNATAQTPSSSESFSGNISLHKVSKTGSYNDLLNKPTIPSAQVQSDWSQNDAGAVDHIKNRTHYLAAATYTDVWHQSGVEVGSGTSSPGAYSGTFTLTVGNLYRVIITNGNNSKTYADVIAESNPGGSGILLRRNWSNISSSPSAQSDAFYILVQASTITSASVDVYGNSCTVQVSAVTPASVVQLPEIFIPDTIARVANIRTVYPVVTESMTTGTYTLPPNTFVQFGTIESIGFTLDTASEVSGYVNEYVVQFNTYHTPPTVGFPSTVIFPETLTLEADMTYQISIVNNLALVQSWPNS